jgi:hypothetical protein
MNNGTFEKISEKSEFRYPTFDIYSTHSTKIGTISFTYSMSKWFYTVQNSQTGTLKGTTLDNLIQQLYKVNRETNLYFKKVNITPTPTKPSKGN